MDAGKYQESSSLRFSRCKYQVFLSFRGEDTRKNFTDHLYTALVQEGIHTFRDDDEIRRGENIELELKKATQQSRMSIIVFSKDYASSRWCLDELVMIMGHKRTAGCMVLPVFYDVDPSQVRKQTGSFATAFEKHKERFKEEIQRVNGWRIALKEVADLGGMVLGDGYEAQFVQCIVKEVSKKLDRRLFHVPLHFIGRRSLIDDINSWLHSGSHGAAIAILYGIGGVGKSTIAKSVYNQNFDKFEGRSFLANVGERSKESNGLVYLQRQLLSDILRKNADEIDDVDEGIERIKLAICCRRTLIVLDDVATRDQFKSIIGMQDWLCKGSKIIVTTRNKGLIDIRDECLQCKVELLDNKASLELFSWHAFGQAHPIKEFEKHSKRVVRHCNGLPLALCVIGSSLSGKMIRVWESRLHEMEAIPNCEVQKVLRASYDSLDDDYEKNLFLDIACFFIGMDKDYAVTIVDGLGLGATFRIDNLINRCLLEIDKGWRLWMHQLIRDMGREIAHQESGKCQRIWHHKEAFMALKETTQDTKILCGLTLDMHELMEKNFKKVVRGEDALETLAAPGQRNFFKQCYLPTFLSWGWLTKIFFDDQAQTGPTRSFPLLSTDSFRKMQNLKFLQLNYVKFAGSYEHFPKNLIWLCWHGFSLRSIPKEFCLEELVVLDLHRSCLVDVWKGKKYFPKLKILDLSHSYGLIRTPDLSGLQSLEKLILEDCIHLVKIHESIGDLQSLVILNLRNCKSLVELPVELSRMNSLKKIDLYGCSNLDGLNLELEQLQQHRLFESEVVVASTSYITAMLLKLFFQYSWFSKTKSSRFTTSFLFPSSLFMLDLRETPICFLPESISALNTLNFLMLSKCRMLQRLPKLPSNLIGLDVSSCDSLQSVSNLTKHSINVSGCEQLVNIQDLIKLEFIEKVSLHMFKILETVIVQMRPFVFQIILEGNIFHVLLPGIQLSGHNKKFGDEWVIQSGFLEFFSFKISNISFKISSSAERRICGLNLFTMFSAMSGKPCRFVIKIINNTNGRSKVFKPNFLLLGATDEIAELSSLSHWKYRGDDHDLDLDDGDEVSVLVTTCDPSVQIKTVGAQLLYEDDGNGHNEVIISHSSSSSSGNPTLGEEEHVAKAQIASHLFSNYFCSYRYIHMQLDEYLCLFWKKT